MKIQGNRIPKVLIVSDSPYIHTGFANVGRHVGLHLARTGKYDVHYLGWFHTNKSLSNFQIPFPVYTTITYKTQKSVMAHEMAPDDGAHRGDAYGQNSFNHICGVVKPDIVFSIGDVWMVYHIMSSTYRESFHHVHYSPIDGDPYPTTIKNEGSQSLHVNDFFNSVDVLVAYGKYGMKEMNRICARPQCHHYIYHGVDTDVFHPLTIEERIELKQKIHSVSKDTFIIGFVSRNQPRKCPNLLIRATKIFIDKYKPNRPIQLYLHAALEDPSGWDIPALTKYYGLQNVMVNQHLQVGQGVSEKHLNLYYNTMDCHCVPNCGEGFGLFNLESLACGIPNIATNISAHPEWCVPGSILVDIPENRRLDEVKTNIRRGYANPDDLAEAINVLYNDAELRDKLGKAGREKALTMDWKIICKEWEDLFDNLPEAKVQQEKQAVLL